MAVKLFRLVDSASFIPKLQREPSQVTCNLKRKLTLMLPIEFLRWNGPLCVVGRTYDIGDKLSMLQSRWIISQTRDLELGGKDGVVSQIWAEYLRFIYSCRHICRRVREFTLCALACAKHPNIIGEAAGWRQHVPPLWLPSTDTTLVLVNSS